MIRSDWTLVWIFRRSMRQGHGKARWRRDATKKTTSRVRLRRVLGRQDCRERVGDLLPASITHARSRNIRKSNEPDTATSPIIFTSTENTKDLVAPRGPSRDARSAGPTRVALLQKLRRGRIHLHASLRGGSASLPDMTSQESVEVPLLKAKSGAVFNAHAARLTQRTRQ